MQSLLSREFTRVQRALQMPQTSGLASAAAFGANARHVVLLGVCLGGGLAAFLSALTWLVRGAAVRALTSNAPVGALCVAVMPAVLVCQCLKGLAYPANAVLMGGRDWLFSTAGMWASSAALVGSLMLWLPAPPAAGAAAATAADGARALLTIWQALGLTFGVQVATSMLRYLSGTGPWRVLTGKSAPRAARGPGEGAKAS